MPGHFMIQTPDTPARFAQSHAQLGLFACNQVFQITVDLAQRLHADQCVATTSLRFPNGRVPFSVA